MGFSGSVISRFAPSAPQRNHFHDRTRSSQKKNQKTQALTNSSGITLLPPQTKYTVPAIHHIPTNTYLMDSSPIAAFLCNLHPSPPLTLTSPLGTEIETAMRAAGGPAWRRSITPRELAILSPRAAEYFRSTREAALGSFDELLNPEEEEKTWQEADEKMKAVGDMMRKNAELGPFVLGGEVSMTDFVIAAHLQLAKVVDEGVFERMRGYKGFGDIYQACLEWMEKKD